MNCHNCGIELDPATMITVQAATHYYRCPACSMAITHYGRKDMYAESGIGYELPAEAVEQMARIEAYEAAQPRVCHRCGQPSRYSLCAPCAGVPV